MDARLKRFFLSGCFALIILALALSGATALSAQTISGVIAGRVLDEQKKVMVDVSVTIKNPDTGKIRTTSTDENGEFRFAEVQPGRYEVIFEKEGFSKLTRQDVVVSVNKRAYEEATLFPKPEVTTVEVSTSPMTDPTGPTISLYFPPRQVQELPLLTRDVNNLALLAPGILSVRSFSFSSTLVPFSVNGSRGRDNNFIIDSVDNNEPLFGGAATQFTNTDIFAEYTILTNQLKAEFGRNSGATINVITKQGSNEIHGTMFWYGQHNALNSLSQVEEKALLASPARYYESQLGATLGGPVKKEKAFYFLSYQWDRSTSNLSNVFPVISTLPTSAGLTALRSLPVTPALVNLLATPTVANVPGTLAPCFNEIPPPPASGFNTQNPCRAPFNVQGSPTTSVPFSTFLVPNSNVFNVQDHQLSGRYDHKINNENDFYARYLFDDITVPRFPLSPAGDSSFSDLGLLPDWQLITRQRSQSLLLNHRRYWKRALNEFRFAYSRVSQGVGSFRAPAGLRDFPAASITDNFGRFDVFQANFLSAGTRFALGRDSSTTQSDSNIFQFQENFSFSRRNHNFKFGVNFVRIQSNILNMPSDLGLYFYETFFRNGFQEFAGETGMGNSRATVALQRLPNIISDPATGTITGQGNANLPLREFDQFYFFQDDWQVTPGFTFSWGLRYENFGQPINRIRELNSRGPSVARDDNNFAPRLGFAWAPANRVVVRGGYALMYNPIVLSIPLLIWQSAPISPLAISITPQVQTFFGITGGPQVVGSYPNAPFTPASINQRVTGCSFPFDRNTTGTVPYINCASQDTVDPDLVNPYVHNYSLGVQVELTNSLLWEIGFVGSKGTKLFLRENRNPYRGWNTNNTGGTCPLFDPFFTNFGCRLPRINASRGQIAAVTNGGSSTYNSLQTSMTRRLREFVKAGDIAFTIAYTWSHNIDNASEILGPGVRQLATILPSGAIADSPLLGFFFGQAQGFENIEAITPFAQDPNNLWRERGNSAFDRRHRFAFSYVWDIAPRIRNPYLRGWQWSGVVTYQSGQPFNPLNSSPISTCADFNGDGLVTNDRPSIGNPNAPAGSIALINTALNPNCAFNGVLSYIDRTGAAIDPASARFVQVPVGLRVGQTFTVGGNSFVAGDSGRNILVGPNSWSWDMSILKNFYFRHNEKRYVQLRWEVYNLFDRRNPGNPLGNVFSATAQAAPAYAYSPSFSPARATGVIPENALDAFDFGSNQFTFLSREGMNTSTRRMQFAIRVIF